MQGYDFTSADLPTLLKMGYFPEQPKPESGVIHDWLEAHGAEYDRFSFSVRLGVGQTANPDHEPGVQKSAEFTSKKRVDFIAWSGQQATIGEAKIRVSPDAHGKLLMYRQLFLEENPDANEPELLVIGRYMDPDVERVFVAHGINVFIYTPEQGE
jgi:hypothetical protein